MSDIAGLRSRTERRDGWVLFVVRALVGATLALGIGACAAGAHGGGAKPVAEFPTQQQLNAIAAQAPTPIQEEPVFRLAEWSPTPVEAAPEAGTASAPTPPAEDQWTRLFNEVAAAHSNVRIVPALSCAAKELARLYNAHGQLPDRRAQAFIEGACGATSPLASAALNSGKVPDTVSDAELYTAWSTKLRTHLDEELAKGTFDAGFAFVRANGAAATVMLVAPHSLDGVRTPIVADSSGRTLIEGTMAQSVRWVQGYINQGPYDARECIRDSTVALPRFRLWCQMQPGDAYAWADIEIVEPERILGRVVGHILVRAAADSELKYSAGSDSVTAANTADARVKLLEQINALRARAGAQPLSTAERQAVSNERLAPHFFAGASDNHEDQQAEESIMLGLVAGWNVSGMIRNGDFYAELLAGTSNVTDLVGALYDQPTARHVLMDRDARQIAIGSVLLPNAGGIGVVVTTYSFFESNDHQADEAALFARIAAQRQAKHLPPTTRLDGAGLESAAQQIQRGVSPDEALRSGARRSVRAGYSFLIQTTDLRRVELPSELFQNRPLQLALAITHYRAPGGAWGQYVVMFVVSQ